MIWSKGLERRTCLLATIESCTVIGVDAIPVDVEVDVSPGLPSFEVVGLPGTAVRESRDRVRAAVRNSGFDFPLRRVTVNLAPANLRKEGALFDLAIAVGVLVASKQLPGEAFGDTLVVGELSLDGSTKAIRGGLSVAILCRRLERRLVIPATNLTEVSHVDGLKACAITSLGEIARGLPQTTAPTGKAEPRFFEDAAGLTRSGCDDIRDVRGQQRAKRVMEIAAAGGHSVLLVGPPGAGKTMLARRLPGLLPPLEWEEALMVTRIYSVAGLLPEGTSLIRERPFRSPHHTTTLAGLVGGGASPKPGEISLAHRGVLFLDEFPEWPQSLRESLRQPLEDGKVVLSRAGLSVGFPAEPLLVLAANPCPCGFAGDDEIGCRCSEREFAAYRQRLSGPILDRVDLRVEVGRMSCEELVGKPAGEGSKAVRERVRAARERQRDRSIRAGYGSTLVNALQPARALGDFMRGADEAMSLLQEAVRRHHLSARGYHRVLKVSRTIADLEGAGSIRREHVAEALQYRWSPESRCEG